MFNNIITYYTHLYPFKAVIHPVYTTGVDTCIIMLQTIFREKKIQYCLKLITCEFMQWTSPSLLSSIYKGLKGFNLLYTGTPYMGTLANSEDPDEMQHNA